MKKRKSKRFNTGGETKPDWMVEDERGIESIYPEELLPIGRAAKNFKNAIEGGTEVLERVNRAKNTINQIHPDFLDKSGKPAKYAVRNFRGAKGAEELEDIRKTGRMLPPKGKDTKYFTSTSREGTQDVRVPLDKVPKRGAVRKEDIEVLNKETGKYETMKKGGAVKKYAKGGSVSSASSRADGCAQRGKTRGKLR